MRTHTWGFKAHLSIALDMVESEKIEKATIAIAAKIESGGRIFLIGNGGSAANASHAVNDFRKICGIEAHCPTDNAAEFTALANDISWNAAVAEWLRGFKIGAKDVLIVLSVGGGGYVTGGGTSMNLILAATAAKQAGATVIAIVGKDGGECGQICHHRILITTVREEWITPFCETIQVALLHLIVNHPLLKKT